LAVLGIATRRSYGRDRLFGSAIFFSVLAAAGVAAWLLWNRVIFGSFTDFATGQFAKSSIWVGQSDVAVGNVLLSVETYALAVTGTVGLPIVLLGVGGVIAYLLIGRLRPTFVAPLTLLVFVPFFVFALYSGQRPLHVAQISGDQYNTRFGLVMLLPMALFTAYLTVTLGHWLTDIVRQRNPASTGASVRATRATVGLLMGAVALLVFAGTAMAGGILTLQEPLNWGANRTVLDGAADALRDDYDGGRVLMQGWGNEYVEFASHVPASETIYEGSYQLWQPALADPAGANIRWIYLSRASTDLVWQSLGTSAALTDYTIRFDDGTRVIYQRQT
jgi:sorbitol-specific phosphotransferase system component IIC